jgi:hypothetical protein
MTIGRNQTESAWPMDVISMISQGSRQR